MFEKEAKERARDYTENKGRQIAYECGFLDGVDRMRGEMQKLKEDNADLKQSLDWANERKKEYANLMALRKYELNVAKVEKENEKYYVEESTKAKELLRELYSVVKVECSPFVREEHKNILTETLEFLQEE